jgi:hypothetical protein
MTLPARQCCQLRLIFHFIMHATVRPPKPAQRVLYGTEIGPGGGLRLSSLAPHGAHARQGPMNIFSRRCHAHPVERSAEVPPPGPRG